MQRLPKDVHERIASEFRFAATKMAESPDLGKKAYFYSAFYGEVTRALNRFWSAELSLIHTVLLASHNEIKGRLDSAMVGGLVGLPDGFGKAWDSLAGELATLFEAPEVPDGPLYALLGRISELAFAVTGNGYYLYLKGAIKISDSPTAPRPPSSRSRAASQRKTSRR